MKNYIVGKILLKSHKILEVENLQTPQKDNVLSLFRPRIPSSFPQTTFT
jgi:hypothetical protein